MQKLNFKRDLPAHQWISVNPEMEDDLFSIRKEIAEQFERDVKHENRIVHLVGISAFIVWLGLMAIHFCLGGRP